MFSLKSTSTKLLLFGWIGAGLAHADRLTPITRIQDLTLELPSGWSTIQQALDEGTGVFVFENSNSAVTMFVKPGNPPDPRQFLVNGSTVMSDPTRESFNGHAWTIMETKKTARQGSAVPTQFVLGFFGKFQNNAYYGYARGSSSENARTAAIEFLSSLN